MKLTSTAFQHIESIPLRFTADGEDLSPPLLWSGLPTNTASLAILCEDPDAPRSRQEGPFVHWVLFNLLPELGMLPEGLPKEEVLGEPWLCRQGVNSMNQVGYNGPAPPVGHGMHRYFFRLLALDKLLELPHGVRREELLRAASGHVLGETELLGTYEREKKARGKSASPQLSA